MLAPNEDTSEKCIVIPHRESKLVKNDTASLRGTITSQVYPEPKKAYDEIQPKIKAVGDFLTEQRVEDLEISTEVNPKYVNTTTGLISRSTTRDIEGYIATSTIAFRLSISEKVALIGGTLTQLGVVLRTPNYSVKPDNLEKYELTLLYRCMVKARRKARVAASGITNNRDIKVIPHNVTVQKTYDHVPCYGMGYTNESIEKSCFQAPQTYGGSTRASVDVTCSFHYVEEADSVSDSG